MKFNSYIVELKLRENSLTGSLLIDAIPVSVNFKKIAPDLFVAQFKTQVELSYLAKIALKNRDKDVVVLLPVISKYNKRKLTKLSKMLASRTARESDKYNFLFSLASIDKFVKMAELLDFFALDKEEIKELLIDKEVKEEVKIINYNNLSVTSFENFQSYRQQLEAIFTECFTTVRHQSLKFSEIETKIKLPQSSIFFKYLIHTFTRSYSFTVQKDKLAFQKVALPEDVKDSMVEIADILKENKLTIFSINNILKLSEVLVPKDVNDTLWGMIEKGEVVRLNEEYFMFANELEKIVNRLKTYKRNMGEMIDIKTFREFSLYSRKYIIILFEYFDTQDITVREGNQRKILLGA
ncbi:MAG: hypothetical protein GY757_05120 [bacterium]|nr:hypothetical protein [bacterium]